MDRQAYAAEAARMYAQPPKADQPWQKFPRGSRVKVDDVMPPTMWHFEAGFEGIVEYTYAQKYYGKDVDSYSLIVLDKDGLPINSIAWYHEGQLTLLSDDTATGLAIIEAYEKRRRSE